MLVKQEGDEEHHVVMGIIFNENDLKQHYVYSGYESARGQYPQEAKGCTIIDDTIPDYWEYDYDKYDKWHILSFPEWTRDRGRPGKPGFYERYLDGDPRALETFERYFNKERQKYENDPKLARETLWRD